MGILDYFTPEARRGNREWLDSQNAAISEALRYYLGPTGIPDRLGLLAESTPTAGLERAGTESSRMFAPGLSGWDRMAAAGNMLSETAGAGAGLLGMPAAGRMADDLVEAAAPMVQPFMADEFGGFRLYQGGPHNFAAERLVRMPDGSTQYVVGAPDRLPDVPVGAEVLQDFPLGRQRMDKIGTGEGAQAYGYGLYGAEAEDVARGYRDALSGSAGNAQHTMLRKVMAGTTPDRVLPAMQRIYPGTTAEDIARLTKEIETAPSSGSIYEMQVNADPEAFLDWDKPLSEQTQAVQSALAPMVQSRLDALESAGQRGRQMAAEKGFPDFTPKPRERLYQEMRGGDIIGAARMGQLQGNVENILSEAGIPGIRYLDSGSRGAGAGTRNYVIFDENLISIVRKYGIAGAAAMLGMSQADVAQAMGQQPQGLLESGPQ